MLMAREETPTVVETPSACQRCGSTQRTRRSSVKKMRINVTVAGVNYNEVRWARCSCRKCGARRIIKSYHHVEVQSGEQQS